MTRTQDERKEMKLSRRTEPKHILEDPRGFRDQRPSLAVESFSVYMSPFERNGWFFHCQSNIYDFVGHSSKHFESMDHDALLDEFSLIFCELAIMLVSNRVSVLRKQEYNNGAHEFHRSGYVL